jgi:hypothetical protein
MATAWLQLLLQASKRTPQGTLLPFYTPASKQVYPKLSIHKELMPPPVIKLRTPAAMSRGPRPHAPLLRPP